MLIGDAPWSRFPTIGPAPAEPLAWNPILQIETPETQYLIVDDVETLRQWGLPLGEITESQSHPSLSGDYSFGVSRFGGVGPTDDWEQYGDPTSSVERVRRFDKLHCTDIDPAAINPVGVAFELVRQRVDAVTIGVVQRIITTWSVTALDDAGDPLFAYGQNGLDMCVGRLLHPTAGVGSLTWDFRMVRRPKAWASGAPLAPYAGPVSPSAIVGDDLVEPWTDLRYGSAATWGDDQYVLAPPDSEISLWLTVRGPTDRFLVERCGARLAGFTQRAGRRGAALCSVTNRYP